MKSTEFKFKQFNLQSQHTPSHNQSEYIWIGIIGPIGPNAAEYLILSCYIWSVFSIIFFYCYKRVLLTMSEKVVLPWMSIIILNSFATYIFASYLL